MSGKRIAQASGRDLSQIEDNDQVRKVCTRKRKRRRRKRRVFFFISSSIIAVKLGKLLSFTFTSRRFYYFTDGWISKTLIDELISA